MKVFARTTHTSWHLPHNLHRRFLQASATLVLPGALLLALWSAPGAPPVQASSRDAREAGAVLFHERGCEYCHGVNGVGSEKGPDLSTIGKRLKSEQIQGQIVHGGNGMPAFGEALTPIETADLVEFLHNKRSPPRKP